MPLQWNALKCHLCPCHVVRTQKPYFMPCKSPSLPYFSLIFSDSKKLDAITLHCNLFQTQKRGRPRGTPSVTLIYFALYPCPVPNHARKSCAASSARIIPPHPLHIQPCPLHRPPSHARSAVQLRRAAGWLYTA